MISEIGRSHQIEHVDSLEEFLTFVRSLRKKWPDESVERKEPVDLWYRGHETPDWSLTPSLFRYRNGVENERNLYNQYVQTNFGDLPQRTNSWETLFDMQHYGVPTRLLDWTEKIGVALYFAVSMHSESPCVYVLNPSKLEKPDFRVPEIEQESNGYVSYLTKLEESVGVTAEVFSDGSGKIHPSPRAVIPLCANARLTRQRGRFTIHGTSERPLELQCPNAIVQVVLRSEQARKDAVDYLNDSNLHAYTLFPEFDGMVQFIKNDINLEPKSIDDVTEIRLTEALFQLVNEAKNQIAPDDPDDSGPSDSGPNNTETGVTEIGDTGAREMGSDNSNLKSQSPETSKLAGLFSACNFYPSYRDSYIGEDETMTATDRIVEWINKPTKTPKDNILFVVGDAGIGKTNLLANTILFFPKPKEAQNADPISELKRKSFIYFPLHMYRAKSNERPSSLEDAVLDFAFEIEKPVEQKTIEHEHAESKSTEESDDVKLNESERRIAGEMIRSGKVVLVLDGLDELARSQGEQIIDEIFAEFKTWKANDRDASASDTRHKIIISCRKSTMDRIDRKKIEKERFDLKELREKDVREKLSELAKGISIETDGENSKAFNTLVTTSRLPIFFSMVQSQPKIIRDFLNGTQQNHRALYELWLNRILGTKKIDSEKMSAIASVAALMASERSETVREEVIYECFDHDKETVERLCAKPFGVFIKEFDGQYSFSHQSLRAFILAWEIANELSSLSSKIDKGVLSQTTSFSYHGNDIYRFLSDFKVKEKLIDCVKGIRHRIDIKNERWNRVIRNLFEAIGQQSLENSENGPWPDGQLTAEEYVKEVIELALPFLEPNRDGNDNMQYVNYRTKYKIARVVERLHPSAPQPYFAQVFARSETLAKDRNHFAAYTVRGMSLKKTTTMAYPVTIFKKNYEQPENAKQVSDKLLDVIDALNHWEQAEDAIKLRINASYALIRWLPHIVDKATEDRIMKCLDMINPCPLTQANFFWALYHRYGGKISDEFKGKFGAIVFNEGSKKTSTLKHASDEAIETFKQLQDL